MVLVKEFTCVNRLVYQVLEDCTDPDCKRIQILIKKDLSNELHSVTESV